MRNILSLTACLLLCVALQAGAQLTTPLGVEFLGRDQYATGDPACQGVNPTDVAGVVPQGYWFAVDNFYNVNLSCDPTTFSADNGTTTSILDTNGNPTGVTLSFSASDSWDDNVNIANITMPNAKLMQGTIKQANGSHVPITFTFNNVPPGQYDVYVYCDLDGNGMVASLWDFYNISTNYILEQQQFYDTNTFVQSTATSAASATTVANYVKFSLGTDARGQIGILGQYVQSTLGMGVTAIQLVPKGALLPNTTPVSFLSEPASRRGALGASNITFQAAIRGPLSYLQWFRNGAPIPGETNLTYTPSPIASGDNGAAFSVIASNNVNSITSTNAILTVGQFVTNNGVGVLDGGIINITTQPQSATIIANRGTAAFTTAATTAGFTGDTSGAQPPLNYQWQTAPPGSSTFTNIPNATHPSYRTTLLGLADNGRQYRNNITYSTLFSSVATVTVLPNTNPPVVTAGAIAKNNGTTTSTIEVGVSFDEQVDQTTLVPGNFSLSSGSISSLKVATNSFVTYQSAILEATGLTPGSTYTLTAKGVTDLSGNVLKSTNVSFTVPTSVYWAEIGTPPAPGQVIPVGTNGFDILNGGRQEWNSYDEVDMAYVVKTNDFDVQVQVIYVEPASEWTRCGLVARNWLDIGNQSDAGGTSINSTNHLCSAYAQTHVNGSQDLLDTGLWDPSDPVQIANAGSNNNHEQNQRLAAGAATTSWLTGTSVGPPQFPDNVFLRLARQGTLITGYASTDGVNWTNQGTTTLTDQTNVMCVGVSLSVETGNIWPASGFNVFTAPFDPKYDRLFVAQFRNFKDHVASSGGTPTLSISESASGISITFSGSGLQQSPTVGPGATWTAVTGAKSPYPVPKGASTMFYRGVP